MAARLLGYDADILVVTEFRANPAGLRLITRLEAAGYDTSHPAVGTTQNTVLIAARGGIERSWAFDETLDPRHLWCAEIDGAYVCGVYMPQNTAKLPCWEALIGGARAAGIDLLIGDFNTGTSDLDNDPRGSKFIGPEMPGRLIATGYSDMWRSLHFGNRRDGLVRYLPPIRLLNKKTLPISGSSNDTVLVGVIWFSVNNKGTGERRTEDARKAMTESTSDRLGRLDAACKRDLGDPDLWFAPDGYPNSLALCVVDSIYSTGAHYSSVINVVRRYRDDRQERGGDASTDGASELAGSIDARGGPDAWATAIGNRRPTSTSPGAPLKADAIYRLANNLVDAGTDTAEAFRSAVANGRADELKSLWRSTPGQRSGITWEYALMLLGVPGVKADRMVVRYVARALERPTLDVSPVEAAELVRGVAERNDWNVIRIDHAIWRFESGRPVNRERDPVQPEQPDE